MSISALLGERRTVDTPAGTIEYRESGSGPPVVFVHGVGVNGDLWRGVAPRLAGERRCIVPDLPFGAHSSPLREDADMSLPGLAGIVADFMRALDLDDVAIVANDTGGAVAQWLVGHRPERIARLVLTSCDAFEKFPPTPQRYLELAARWPPLLGLVAWTVRFKFVQRLPTAYGWTTQKPIDPAIMRSYTGPIRVNAGVRRDLRRLLLAVDTRFTYEAAESLRGFDKPALVLWGTATSSSRGSTESGLRSSCPRATSTRSPIAARSSLRTSPSALPLFCRSFSARASPPPRSASASAEQQQQERRQDRDRSEHCRGGCPPA